MSGWSQADPLALAATGAPMSDTKTRERAIGMRYGLLLASLNTAKKAIEEARSCWDLLGASEQKSIEDLHDHVLGMEQRVWTAWNKMQTSTRKPRRR